MRLCAMTDDDRQWQHRRRDQQQHNNNNNNTLSTVSLVGTRPTAAMTDDGLSTTVHLITIICTILAVVSFFVFFCKTDPLKVRFSTRTTAFLECIHSSAHKRERERERERRGEERNRTCKHVRVCACLRVSSYHDYLTEEPGKLLERCLHCLL